MIAAWPCGVVPMVEELYGVESLSQVHGLLCEFLDTGKDVLKDLKTIFYDDACHLIKYSQKQERMEVSDAAKRLGELEMFVDFFHIKNHIDPICHEKLNPYTQEHLKNINSSVCEQTFSWMNRFMQTKAMNRARYLFFFIYLLDRHNLHIEGRLHETHPKIKANDKVQKIPDANSNDVNFETKYQEPENVKAKGSTDQNISSSENGTKEPVDVNEVLETLKGMTIASQPETHGKPKQIDFPCPKCDIKPLKTQAGLKKHLLLAHEIDEDAHLKTHKCEVCGKSFKQKFTLTRHMKSKKCSKLET